MTKARTYETNGDNFQVAAESENQIVNSASQLNLGWVPKPYQVSAMAAQKQRRHVWVIA